MTVRTVAVPADAVSKAANILANATVWEEGANPDELKAFHKVAVELRAAIDAPDVDPLKEVYDFLQIGSAARTPEVLMENIRNMVRRTHCLDAIEQKFFTTTKLADMPEEEGDTIEECAMSWGAAPADYVDQFRAALVEKLGGLAYPAEMSEAMAEVLGRPNFTCIKIAQGFRHAGYKIATRSEAEQAFTIHYLLKFVLQHGADWLSHAQADMTRIFEEAKARAKAANSA